MTTHVIAPPPQAPTPATEAEDASPRRVARNGQLALTWAVRLGSLVAAVLVWHLLTENDVQLWLRFNRLPGPVEVFEAFRIQLGTPEFYQDLAQSVVRILTGFAIASAVGIALGIALARSRWVSNLLQPLLEVFRPIPAIALVPVAILLFPTNEQASSSSPRLPPSSRSWSAPGTPCAPCPRCGRTHCARWAPVAVEC